MTARLTVKNLAKVYSQGDGVVKALKSISLRVKAGEFVCIIGPNGSGKSTLLKLIAGIESPTAGTLQAAAGGAYVPQQASLLPWRTVEANLALPAEIQPSLGITPDDIKRWLTEFGLSEFAAMYPAALSGGMQQKVALIRAALFSSSLLLLDEPFAALDAITRRELQAWLLDFKQKTRATVVCVTHDIHEAVFLADTIYVLSPRPGRIEWKFIVKHPATGRRLPAAAYIQRLEKTLTGLVAGTP
jgi:ABC-type nitrate/sulfonate/bicarbonate transport system ATPase subunit